MANGFEPSTSASRTQRSVQAELRPVGEDKRSIVIPLACGSMGMLAACLNRAATNSAAVLARGVRPVFLPGASVLLAGQGDDGRGGRGIPAFVEAFDADGWRFVLGFVRSAPMGRTWAPNLGWWILSRRWAVWRNGRSTSAEDPRCSAGYASPVTHGAASSQRQSPAACNVGSCRWPSWAIRRRRSPPADTCGATSSSSRSPAIASPFRRCPRNRP